MKTRTGFVSNSSSSSFVILGMEVKKGSEIFKKFFDEDCSFKFPDSFSLGTQTYDEGNYFGLSLGGGDETDFGSPELTFSQIENFAKEFKNVFGVEPKLFGGVELS